MTRPVELSPAAAQDVREVTAHYVLVRPELGRQFVEHFERVCRSITSMPESFDPVSDIHRRAFIPRFPHFAYFQVETDRIVILAVLHSARHSRTWKQRLAGDS